MNVDQIILSIFGGALIGTAVTLMLLFNGRVTGISGIIASTIAKPSIEGLWRWMFLVGLISGGLLMNRLRPDLFVSTSNRSIAAVAVAGLLVGYGTVMASGCTSGHGICGIGRLSIRSVLATLVFMFFGFLTVQTVKFLFGGSL